MADCGTDAHAHVANCQWNRSPGRGVYTTEALWREGRTQSKREAVRGLLHQVDAALAALVVADAQKDLEDVGLGDITTQFR